MIEAEIVEQPTVDVTPAPESKPEKVSVRQALEKNYAKVEKAEKAANPEAKPEEKTTAQRDRDADIKKPVRVQHTDGNEGTSEAKPVIEKPKELPKQLQGWRKEAKDSWDKIPEVVQNEIIRREEESHKKITSNDEERTFGKTLKDIIAPYTPLINAEGSDAPRAIQSLLNTAYQLRNSTPQQKGILLWQLAKQYGADMRIDPKLVNQPVQPQRPQQQINVESLVEQHLQKAKAQSDIEAFASDPKNIHFEKVKPAMAILLKSGQAMNLNDAYKKACYADDDVREEMINQQIAERNIANSTDNTQRVAQVQAKTKAAKNASASVTGAPGLGGSAESKKKGLTTRQLLEKNWDAITSH